MNDPILPHPHDPAARADDVTVRAPLRLGEVPDRRYRCHDKRPGASADESAMAVSDMCQRGMARDRRNDADRQEATVAETNCDYRTSRTRSVDEYAGVTDELGASPQCHPTSARRRRNSSRSCRIQAASVELIPAAGKAGDELDARQDAAIRKVLLWLGSQREMEQRL